MFKQIKLLLFLKKKRKGKAVMYDFYELLKKIDEKSIYFGKRFKQLMCLFM